MSAILNISIDLSSPELSDRDKAVLAALGLTPGGDWPPAPAPAPAAVVVDVQVGETVTEEAEEKPAPKARAPRKSRAKKAETEEAPSASGPAALEDLPTATRSEGIEWAIKLSDRGLKDELRACLDTVGAARASALEDGEQSAKFIAEVKSVLASQPAEKAAPEAEEAPEEEAPAEAPAEPAAGRTLQDAIDAAMKLVHSGGADKVRAAVKEIGVAKVSAMTEDQVQQFFAFIEA